MKPNETQETVDNYIRERLRSSLEDAFTEFEIDMLRKIVMVNYFSKLEDQLPNDYTDISERFLEAELKDILENSIFEICDMINRVGLLQVLRAQSKNQEMRARHRKAREFERRPSRKRR